MMNWDLHLSKRASLMQGSAVREFLKIAAQPGMISFAGGLPDTTLLPVDELQAATERAITNYGPKVLQYGATEGAPQLREYVASRFRSVGAVAENVLITTGSQQALDLVGRVLLNEGDTVAVQNPTYLAALSAWRPYGVSFCGGTATSPLPDEPKVSPRAIYCIPNFQNPTGESLTHDQRLRLTNWACAKEIPLIEDDPYGELRYEGEKLPSLLELSGGLESSVLHLGTFSKVLAPGLRVGWIVGSSGIIKRLALAKQALDLHTSTLCQYVALEFALNGRLQRSLPKLCSSYREKRDEMLECLQMHLPADCTWGKPAGGFFTLLTLPEETDGSAFSRAALAAGVAVIPGAEFHVCGGRNTVRLSFSVSSRTEIREGVRRLGKVLQRTGNGSIDLVESTLQRSLM